jgi:hypothetical protein
MYGTLVLFILGFFIFLARECTNSDTEISTPSSKEYVDSLVREVEWMQRTIDSNNEEVAAIKSKNKEDSISYSKEIDKYKSMSRVQKVYVVEENIGKVVDTLGLTCLDSIQVDSVNLTFKKAERYKEITISQGKEIVLQRINIDIMKGQLNTYETIIDTSFVEIEQLKVETSKYKKKTKRNRKIALIATSVAIVEGIIIYVAVRIAK